VNGVEVRQGKRMSAAAVVYRAQHTGDGGNSGTGTNLKVGGHRSGAKVGGAQSAEKNFFGSCPSTFWL